MSTKDDKEAAALKQAAQLLQEARSQIAQQNVLHQFDSKLEQLSKLLAVVQV